MTPLRQYARTIERHWSALIDRPVVLGERDWALICDWHERGIPLAVVQESVAALREKLARRRSAPRNLAALAKLVEESWSTVLAGRSALGPAPSAAPENDPSLEDWTRCALGLDAASPLRAHLELAIEQLHQGADAVAIDHEMAAGLIERLPRAHREELEAVVRADLAALKPRMNPGVWQQTYERALLKAARRRLGLPRLSQQVQSR